MNLRKVYLGAMWSSVAITLAYPTPASRAYSVTLVVVGLGWIFYENFWQGKTK
jgi:hypothetical protein